MIVKLLLKISLFLALFLAIFYLFFLKPRLALEKKLTQEYFLFVQNRLAFVELTRLDPKSPNFEIEKSSLVSTLKNTNKKGLEIASRKEEKEIYERQNNILEKVFATKSYEEGVAILKSNEAIELLTDQTNLILELEFQLEKLKVKR